MTLSQTQIYGYARKVIEAIDSMADALRAIHVDPEAMKRDLLELYDRAADADAEQEVKKREAVRSTIDADELRGELYAKISGGNDMLIHAAGKNTPEARNLRRMRSDIYRPPSKPDETPQLRRRRSRRSTSSETP